ncbi:hypothetical protein V8F06_012386 [Rhypophila decipiens]
MDAPVNPNGRQHGWISQPQPHGSIPPPERHGPMVPFNDPSASTTAACRLGSIIWELNRAVDFAEPGIGDYKKRVMVMMSWESETDDGKSDPDAERLRAVFENLYGFTCQNAKISREGDRLVLELSSWMNRWDKEFGSESNLLVFYYALHSTPEVNMATAWQQWIICESILMEAQSDTLVFLNVDFELSGLQTKHWPGASETIAACGWNPMARGPVPRDRLFTARLVAALERLAISELDEGFSVATLYAELLVDLNEAPLDREGRHEKGYRLRKQPIHFAHVENTQPASIALRPVICQHNLAKPPPPSDKVARVVISITLADDEPEDYSPTAIERWLASYHLLTDEIKVEAVYRGLPNVLLLLSLPVGA